MHPMTPPLTVRTAQAFGEWPETVSPADFLTLVDAALEAWGRMDPEERTIALPTYHPAMRALFLARMVPAVSS